MSYCEVCTRESNECDQLVGLSCGHQFCLSCWQEYIKTQMNEQFLLRIECMESGCSLYCLEDFVLQILKGHSKLIEKFKKHAFLAEVKSHPNLKICPGKDCTTIIMADREKAKKVTCNACGTSFCVRCGGDYHAPTSCETIRKWLIKCVDDSETANYISAHTKDCPNCHSCIEKNGGCNHMQCAKCKHHFCWMCFGDWKTHRSEYYECSRYKENPAVAQEANHIKARRALEKYLHYFERYENHHKSLMLEEELRQSILKKVEEKVNDHEGTWIDWQHLHRAATLLTKCRYTLQYTYPYAYYMESGSKKELFEYQQAQLEKEIEELSWKVERAERTERGDLESQMHVAEVTRRTLLEEFFK
uniref:RBR-type E3 ubiquitin transferase n=1 Tax=Syphacia muris TaxID=451379 RepID=A0A0N5AJR5_9BILA